jgi:hypothetical protein
MSSDARDKSVLLDYKEYLKRDGVLRYEIPISPNSKVVTFYTSWQGSRLENILTQPDGRTLRQEDLRGTIGRFAEGKTYQMLEVYDPPGGTWVMEVRWAEPPPKGEQVNILVSEGSDIFANILPFQNQYSLGQPVGIKVQAVELMGGQRVQLKDSVVHIEIKKPGPEMIRMIQAQSEKWTMYKDVMLNITREVSLFDDGSHNDFAARDGIFGNTFTETDKNGPYLVTATITGEKRNGEKVEKILKSSFQVGPISQNPVTTSQVLEYMNRAELQIDQRTPYKEETMSQPMEEIETLQGDPLESIKKLLKDK